MIKTIYILFLRVFFFLPELLSIVSYLTSGILTLLDLFWKLETSDAVAEYLHSFLPLVPLSSIQLFLRLIIILHILNFIDYSFLRFTNVGLASHIFHTRACHHIFSHPLKMQAKKHEKDFKDAFRIGREEAQRLLGRSGSGKPSGRWVTWEDYVRRHRQQTQMNVVWEEWSETNSAAGRGDGVARSEGTVEGYVAGGQ